MSYRRKKTTAITQRFKSYANELTPVSLQSEDVLATDPIVVHALYGRRAKKGTKQEHNPFTVSQAFQADESLAKRIHDMFEATQYTWSPSSASDIADSIMENHPEVFPERRRTALTW